VLETIREGLRFVNRTRVIRSAMWIDFWATFFSGAEALLPAFALKILRLGPTGYGILGGSSAVGALLAASVLAYLPPIRHQGKWVIGMICSYGLCTAFFGLAQTLPVAVLFLALTGASDMVSTVLRQTIRQLATPDNMRGRMNATSSLFHISGPQLGDFEAGALAAWKGERISIVIGGAASVLISLWWRMRPGLREYEHSTAPESGAT
jgi:hypothetical protein